MDKSPVGRAGDTLLILLTTIMVSVIWWVLYALGNPDAVWAVNQFKRLYDLLT